MRRIIAATIAGLALVVVMAAPVLGHTASATCDHITLGNVPKGVSATLTPGPIVISPPNKTTSINGTYEVPPATYMITFSDGSIIHRITVPSCPSPTPSSAPTPTPSSSPTPSPSPSPTPSTSPSASPSVSPSPSPSPTPSASPSASASASLGPSPSGPPTPTVTPTGSSGSVEGATATPRSTAPETATLAGADQDGLATGLPVLLLLLVGINAALALILRTDRAGRQGRPGRRG